MKTLSTAFLCLALASGCLPLRPAKDDALMQSVAPPPPVTAEQVTVENRYEMAQALWDELDREEQQPIAQPAPIGPHPPRRR